MRLDFFLLGGGEETAFHHLNAYGVNLKLKNREAWDIVLKKLSHCETNCAHAKEAIKALSCKIAEFREIQPNDSKELFPEKVSVELTALIDEAALHEEEIAQYRDEIVTLGQDAVKLYCNANQNNIEVDPIIKQIITVFQAFKTLYTPVLVAVSEDTNELLRDLDDFQANVQIFIQTVERSNLNLGLAEQSDYMHILCAPEHIEDQCRYVINHYGFHLSRFSAETSESNHRIMRSLLTRMQGFTNRAVGNVSTQRFASDVTFNKISYLMHDSYIRIFHFFQTLVRKNKPAKCGICDSTEHIQRKCKLPCTLCGRLYFKGHSKKTCRLLDTPLSPKEVTLDISFTSHFEQKKYSC